MADELIAISLRPHCAQCQKDSKGHVAFEGLDMSGLHMIPQFIWLWEGFEGCGLEQYNIVVTLVSMLKVRGANPSKFCTSQVLKRAECLEFNKKVTRSIPQTIPRAQTNHLVSMTSSPKEFQGVSSLRS